MTQEEKQLLLQDICARLPYGVICQMEDELIISDSHFYDRILTERDIELFRYHKDFYIKPYLRPLSSMTEEELYEVQEILGKEAEIRDGFISIIDSSIISFTYLELQAVFEWFNTYHFDYRGLIPKGLAIEVTEENNPYKD